MFYVKFLTDTLAKMSENNFSYFSISEHSVSFLRKTIYVGGFLHPPPPRPVYRLIRNLQVLTPSLMYTVPCLGFSLINVPVIVPLCTRMM